MKRYWDQTASVRIMNALSDEIRIQLGVRQGCVASPTLFNLYTEYIFRHYQYGGCQLKWGGGMECKLISREPSNGCQQETKLNQNKYCHISNIINVSSECNNWGWEIRKGDQEKNKYSPATFTNTRALISWNWCFLCWIHSKEPGEMGWTHG